MCHKPLVKDDTFKTVAPVWSLTSYVCI